MEHMIAAVSEAVRQSAAAGPKVQFTPDTNLLEGGVLDSLGVLGVVAEVENRLGHRFRPEDIVPHNFESVNAIVHLLQQGVS